MQKYVTQLCQHLDRRRFEVTGCCATQALDDCAGDVPFPSALEEAAVPYFMVPMERSIHPVKDVLALGMIYREIRNRCFDIVHAHSSKAGVLARIAACRAGVPVVVYSPHAFSFAAPDLGLSKQSFVFFERVASRWGDMIIADSQGERTLALKYRIGTPGSTVVIPPGIALEEYERKITEQQKAALAAHLEIPKDHKVVTFVGRLARQKDPVTFIRCAQLLERALPQVTFLLIGDGPLRKECSSLVNRGSFHGKMRLLGWRRDYRDFLTLSDAVAIPSVYEGMPFLLLEAMALGKPVIATDVAGNQEVVADGENGMLVPSQAPGQMAEKCFHVLCQPKNAARLGEAARRTVAERFSLGTMISLTEKLYYQLYQKKCGHHG